MLHARGVLLRMLTALIARLLGTADASAVSTVAAREFSLILRSRHWHRFLAMWCGYCSVVFAAPLLFRNQLGLWQSPGNGTWYVLCGYALQIGLAMFAVQWTIRRLRRDLYTHRLDELMLTRCSAADVAMGEALASAFATVWFALAALPVCLLVAALAGQGLDTALRLLLSLIPAGALGVWFGMGWGLAFTLRRTSALVPLTQWWVLGPLLPFIVVWSLMGAFPVIWALLGLIPGGQEVAAGAFGLARMLLLHLLRHWNPVLTVGGAAGFWGTTWFTDWLMLMFAMLFMMRKSMDTIQVALNTLNEKETRRKGTDYWIHHDGHYFEEYRGERRRQPQYRDGGNPIAAFDVALGHRVYLHPFLWCVAIMLYLFLFLWSALLPRYGLWAGTAAVLVPATGALLLMSGGVSISFGWERDQHRWPALAVLPLSDTRLALGKIKGVVRPTLWVALAASLTALILGVREAVPIHVSLWMALHVLLFPVTLAFVSAALALSTPTVGEALYRWAVLGAIPSVAYLLPPPLGGDGGMALPFTPPLMVLMLVAHGATPALIRACWIAFGLELVGICISLLILTLLLRRWTVGERD